MGIRGGVEGEGDWLFGNLNVNPSWLQQTCSAVTPQGDFMCLAQGQKFALYKEGQTTTGKRGLRLILKETTANLQEEEEITSVAVFPLFTSNKLENKAFYTVLGFSSGLVRVYNEVGLVVIEKNFHPSAVKHFKFQSQPEGKQSTNVLYTQSMQELLIVYGSMVVSVSSLDLFNKIYQNINPAASQSSDDIDLSIKGLKFVIKEERVSDCEAIVLTNSTYHQYFQLTMKGGMVDDRYKPVITKPYILTVGQDPFLQYNEKSSSSASAGQLAQNVVSTVTSGIFKVASGAFGSLWSGGGGGNESEAKPVPADPQSLLEISHSLKDSGRDGLEVLISPNKMYSAIRDSQNRVILVDNYSRSIVQMWRGYHRCQMGWTLAGQPKVNSSRQELEEVKEVAAVLVLYLPRRGLIEVWSPEQKVKVTEFQVSKHGTLLKSGGVCLDDGTPRRHEAVHTFTSFLQPNGAINHFHIPFHTLSMSSTAEKDINLQNKIFATVDNKSEEGERFLEEVFRYFQEIRNLRLRTSTLLKLIGNGQLDLQESLQLLSKLRGENPSSKDEDNLAKSMEVKIYSNKLNKVYELLNLYAECTSRMEADSFEPTLESLTECLAQLSEADKEPLFKLISDSSTDKDALNLNLTATQFLNAFDTDGELMRSSAAGKRSPSIGLRKDIDPKIRQELAKFFCKLSMLDSAEDILVSSGISTSEILDTVLASALRFPNQTCQWFYNLAKCFIALLTVKEGSDDRSVSSLQELSKRLILKARIDENLYCVILLWMNALRSVDAPHAYIDDWSRRLHQTTGMVELLSTFKSLLAKTKPNHVDLSKTTSSYSLHSVYDCGNGRVTELVSTWLHKLGSCSLNLPANMDGLNETVELSLITKVSDYFPKSMDVNVLVVHMAWDELQTWHTQDRNDMASLETALLSLSAITCTKLKVMFSQLIWRTFFAKLFRDIVKRTDDFKKSSMNETSICDKEFGIRRDNLACFLSLILAFLDKSLELLRFGELPDVYVEYDNFSLNSQKHLLDHALAGEPPDIDILSLEHQFCVVLYLTWKLKLPSRPLKLFNSVEINNLIKTNTTAVISWFSDYNTSVRTERISWTGLVSETAAGYIHRLPDSQLDSKDYKELMAPVLQLSKVWFLSDVVRVGQCHALYIAGFDSLGSEIRNTFSSLELDKLGEKLMDVVLLRIAKYLHQDPDTAQVATIPAEVVTEVAARRDRSSTVADTPLTDTRELLKWLTETLISEDLHMLATQCLNAVQILEVRKSRTSY